MVTDSCLEKEKAFNAKYNNTYAYTANSVEQFRELIQIFIYHVKTRTPPVYCYPIATVLSFLLISKTHTMKGAL